MGFEGVRKVQNVQKMSRMGVRNTKITVFEHMRLLRPSNFTKWLINLKYNFNSIGNTYSLSNWGLRGSERSKMGINDQNGGQKHENCSFSTYEGTELLKLH